MLLIRLSLWYHRFRLLDARARPYHSITTSGISTVRAWSFVFTIATSMDTFDYYHQPPLAHGGAHGNPHPNVDHGVPNPRDIPYGVGHSMQPPAPADDQTNMMSFIDYGSADLHAFSAFQARGAAGLPQTNEHQLPPHHESQQQSYTSLQVELDLLRETRRIRELELQIAEEKRRESEERRRLREAELALAQMQMPSASALTVSRNSSPPAFDCLQPYSSRTPSSDGLAAEYEPSPDPAAWFNGLDLSHIFGPSFSISSFSPSITPDTYPPCMEQPPFGLLPGASESTASASDPPVSNGKKPKNGRVLDEREAHCVRCKKLMAKLLIRGSREELDVGYGLFYECSECVPLKSSITSRKRSNQVEDTTHPTTCDVCLRVHGHGGFVAKDRQSITFLVEVWIHHPVFPFVN